MIKYIHANAFSILFKLIAIELFEHLQQISSISMSFEDNIDRISIYSVKSTNFTKSTYKSIKKGTRLFIRLI